MEHKMQTTTGIVKWSWKHEKRKLKRRKQKAHIAQTWHAHMYLFMLICKFVSPRVSNPYVFSGSVMGDAHLIAWTTEFGRRRLQFAICCQAYRCGNMWAGEDMLGIRGAAGASVEMPDGHCFRPADHELVDKSSIEGVCHPERSSWEAKVICRKNIAASPIYQWIPYVAS